MGVTVEVVEIRGAVSTGTAGLRSHAHGCCTTVSAMAEASGGIGNGTFIKKETN